MGDAEFALTPRSTDLSHERNNDRFDSGLARVIKFGFDQNGFESVIIELVDGLKAIVHQIRYGGRCGRWLRPRRHRGKEAGQSSEFRIVKPSNLRYAVPFRNCFSEQHETVYILL
jgi:hypothetical protein